MNTKALPIIVGLAVVGLAATAAFMQPKKTAPRTPSPTPVATSTPTGTTATAPATTTGQTSTTTPPASPAPTPAIAAYTLAQVAEHGVDGNCWSAINGQVYDLGAWIAKHPGGDRAILSICGKDGSAAFNGQHGGDRKPERILAGFDIGVLAQ